MDNNVKEVLAGIMAAAEMVSQCRAELVKIGFNEAEIEDILQFYVYDKMCRGEA